MLEILQVLLIFAALIGVPVLLLYGAYKVIRHIGTVLWQRGLGLRDVLDDGVPTTATVHQVVRDRTNPQSRRYVQYRYTTASGSTYEGEVADYGLKTGDTLDIVYSRTNPSVSYVAELVNEARRKDPLRAR